MDIYERFARLDFRVMHTREACMTIALSALAFTLLEVLLHLTVRPLVRALVKRGRTVRGAAEVEAEVTAGVTKLVGAVHNAIQIPVAVTVLLDPALRASGIYAFSRASSAMVLVSSGYFLWDLAQVLLRYEREGAAYLVHAACCLFVYGYAVFSGYLHYYGAAFLLWELSTPFVHLRWALYKAGAVDGRLYLYNGVALVLVFFLCRPLWGTITSARFFADTARELAAPSGDFPAAAIWGYRVANVALNLLNYMWFYKMAAKLSSMTVGGNKPSAVHDGKEG